ncbi:MAG: hypothetical protein JSV88_26560 [Candidatus Aminicenantes bacterium]|nr:MAG: hypothetical protein JSV88_26560 [Candidatus Aminicenantes bacterium]
MAIPALLIGLGGTGQWVLTYLKKELLNYNNEDYIPKEVRLLAFDTERVIEEEAITLTGVSLDTYEFYRLGGNIEKIVREVAEENMHPHITSWLQAKTYINRLSAGQYMLEEGAGNMRPFGRMALFKDLESNPENSKIFSAIRDAIQDIRIEMKENRSIEIYIISSLAGGTGAGIAIDIAHIVRTIAEETISSQNFIIYGFFVLPSAFQLLPGGDNAEMRARGFAALRELNRFITVFGDREYPMIYNLHPQFRRYMQKPIKKRLFDACYLVDARRERNTLMDIEPKFGVFPSIADAMMVLLDEKSGQDYTEHLINMMPMFTRGDDAAYFNAIGTYTFVLPISDIVEENNCKLAIDFLKRLVPPELDNNGQINKLSSTQNQEIPGKRGRDLVENFMRKPWTIEELQGTLYLSEAVKLLEQGGVGNNQLLEEAASRNYWWWGFIVPDDDTEEIKNLRAEVHSILEHSLIKNVETSRGLKEKVEFGCERIEKEVEEYLGKYLGKKQTGESNSSGKFHDALDRYASFHIGRFQKALGGYCIKLLNGTAYNKPEVSKGGKLGFVREFLEGLSQQIEAFCKFMEKVSEIRFRERHLFSKQQEVRKSRSQMFEKCKKARRFNRAAYGSQVAYLKKMEELVELQKNELLFDYVYRIARRFRDHTNTVRESINDWAKALVVGSEEQPSLYDLLNKKLQWIKEKRQQTKNFSRVRHEETDDEFEQKLYTRIANQELSNMFRGVYWKLSEDGKTVALEVFGEELLCQRIKDQDRDTEHHNVGTILKGTRRPVQRLIHEETIGKRLMNRYNDEELAKKLYENGCPLINFFKKPVFGQTTNFLAVQHGITQGDERYFREVAEKISYMTGTGGRGVKLSQYQNAHKCTMIYSIDVINVDCLTAYEDMANAYKQYLDDRRLLHIFPAEVNAAYYEQQVQNRLNEEYRLFNPRIVFILEYKDLVKLFTRCMVYDIIKLVNDVEGNSFWSLQLPKCEHKGKLYKDETIELTPHTPGKADFHRAMHTFVFKQEDFREDFETFIQYDHVDKALMLAEEKVGDEAENIDKLKSKTDSDLIRDLKNSNPGYEQDLGDLMHIMILEEIDRLSELTEKKTTTYHMVLMVTPNIIAVGQKLTLRVEIRPGMLEKNSFKLSRDIPELYCFVDVDGLQLVGDEVAAIPRDPKTGHPIPVEFELQGHVQGKQTFTVELFFEDSESKRLHIIKSNSQVSVVAPKPTQEPQVILPQIDIRVAPQPDFLLQVESNIKYKTDIRYYQVALNYRLTSYLPEVRCKQDKVGEVVLNSTELQYFRTMINQAMGQITNAQPEDIRQRMLSLGTYLFDRLFPPDTTGKFRTMFWKVRDQINTWLMIEDVIKNGVNWIPWELVVPYGKGEDSSLSFLGERYHLSRWVNGLGTTLYGEFPFGDIALIDYKHQTVSEGEEHSERIAWQRRLNAHKARHLREVVQPETPVYAVHLLRYAEQISRREIVDRDQTDRSEEVSPEEDAQQRAKLDIKLKRPVITLSILNQNSIHSSVTLHDVSLSDRVLPFLRAGASAVICPWWSTSEAADQVFWNTFYDLLERRVPLGEAALRARLSVRDAFPHLADWLAYSVFGDPRARIYRPEDSQGYTALECLSPDKYLRPGKTYSFRASISTFPPVGFKGRLVRSSALPDEVQALFLAPGLQEKIPEPIPMVPINPGGTIREATQQFKAPQFPGKYPILVQFFADEEHIKTLKLMLSVDYD